MSDRVYFTICSRNYLAYAHTLYNSLVEADPQSRFVCFLADDPEGTEGLPFEIIGCESLNISTYWDMAFRYTVMEFNTAVKPFCIKYLFERMGAEAAIYLDPDLYIVRPLTHVEQALSDGADIVLTPHALAPLDDGGDPDDVRLMRTGVYNLGFGAFANTPDSNRLVDWWADQLRTKCVVDLEGGLFVDQKFMDLAPAYTRNAVILRHPGYNVAYWNMPHRSISASDGWTVNNEPLHFFHFSGVVPGDYTIFSKHQNRYTAASIGDLKSLLTEYLDRISANDHEKWKTVPYAYNSFVGGQTISDPVRQVYAKLNATPRKGSREGIFVSDFGSYNKVSTEARRRGCSVPLTRVMYAVWTSRKDLRDAFDLNSDASRLAFLNWFVSSGPREVKLTKELIEPALTTLGQHSAPIPSGRGTAPAAVKTSFLGQASKLVLANTDRLRPFYRHLPAGFRQKVVQVLLRQGFGRLASPAAQIESRDGTQGVSSGLNMFGYFNTETGIGEGARRNFHAMRAANIDVHPYAFSTNGYFRDEISEVDASQGPADRRELNLIHINADEMLTLPRLLDQNLYKDSYNIGYWAWELGKFPQAWAEAAEHLDEIWAPSQFVADSIRGTITKPVHTIPHPVRSKPFTPFDRAAHGIQDDTLVILTAFDTNSFYQRKNPMAALEAFSRAFPNGENVALIMKYHGGRDARVIQRTLAAQAEKDPRIILINDVLGSEEMAGLQNTCDIFLSLHRSEGYGLNIAECMSLGKLAVATGYSGNMEYMTTHNSLPVRYEMTAVGSNEYPFAEGQVWADPDIDHAASILKSIHDDPDSFRPLRDAAMETMTTSFSELSVGTLIENRIRTIRQSL